MKSNKTKRFNAQELVPSVLLTNHKTNLKMLLLEILMLIHSKRHSVEKCTKHWKRSDHPSSDFLNQEVHKK